MAHLKSLPQRDIQTPSLELRRLAPADARKIFRMSQEEGMRTWLPSQVYDSESHAASIVGFLISQYEEPADPRRGPYVLGVCLAHAGELIGHVGLSPMMDSVEVGFAIERAQQGKGFAAEAVRAFCDWALGRFSIPGILGVVSARNVASRRTLLKAGFCKEKDALMQFQGEEQTVEVFRFSGGRSARGTASPFSPA